VPIRGEGVGAGTEKVVVHGPARRGGQENQGTQHQGKHRPDAGFGSGIAHHGAPPCLDETAPSRHPGVHRGQRIGKWATPPDSGFRHHDETPVGVSFSRTPGAAGVTAHGRPAGRMVWRK
jgi:hypothetical protein